MCSRSAPGGSPGRRASGPGSSGVLRSCATSGRSVVVPVTVMFRVPVPVMNVVGVIVMLDSDMAAAVGVHVLVLPMDFVRAGHAFIDEVALAAVELGLGA